MQQLEISQNIGLKNDRKITQKSGKMFNRRSEHMQQLDGEGTPRLRAATPQESRFSSGKGER